MTWYLVNVDGRANVTYWTQEPNVTDAGHLEFTDSEGSYRIVSAGHSWTLKESENTPPGMDEDESMIVAEEDAEVWG